MLSQLKPSRLDLGMSTTHCANMPFQASGPPSPTLSTYSLMSSVSWMAEKSSKELIPLLKSAYAALKDKERDLMLAAEIGKSLLENNIRLKSSYEELLQQTKRSAPLIAPLPTPSNSLATFHGDANYQVNGPVDQGNRDGNNDGHYEDDEDASMRFIPSRRTRDAMIEVLERKNTELTRKLEATLAEHEASDRSNVRKTRKLEAEIEALRSNLDIAATKIQELEEMNQRQRRIEQSLSAESHESRQEDEQVVEELLQKIDALQMENMAVSHSKAELEDKLAATLIDLRKLKDQFENFQFTQKDYETLQEAYERQFKHIAELNASVEEHRNVLQRLKERGVNIHSPRSTPAPSVCGSTVSQTIRHTLLGELESEWLKKRNQSAGSPAPSSVDTQPLPKTPSRAFHPLRDLGQFTEKSLSIFCNAPTDLALDTVLAKANHIDRELLDDALSFISRLEQEHDSHESDASESDDEMNFELFDPLSCHDPYPSEHLYPNPNALFQVERVTRTPKTFMGRLRRLVRQFFRAVWRWCRFAMILTVAVLISAWHGPNGLIEY